MTSQAGETGHSRERSSSGSVGYLGLQLPHCRSGSVLVAAGLAGRFGAAIRSGIVRLAWFVIVRLVRFGIVRLARFGTVRLVRFGSVGWTRCGPVDFRD